MFCFLATKSKEKLEIETNEQIRLNLCYSDGDVSPIPLMQSKIFMWPHPIWSGWCSKKTGMTTTTTTELGKVKVANRRRGNKNIKILILWKG